MLQLYHNWNSTCSQKVRICLAEKSLAWTSVHLNLRRLDQLKPEFLKLNPAGVVPVLVDDGHVITESTVINEYLDEAYPAAPLRPVDAHGRARMRRWTKYIDDVPTWAIKTPSFAQNIRPAATKFTADQLDTIRALMPNRETAERWLKAAGPGFGDAEIRADLDKLADMLDRMEAGLRVQAWLAGDGYSLADVNIAPFVHRLVVLGHREMLAQRPHAADWYARILARPAFHTALSFPNPDA
jgi:glutathione S-transferase